MIQSAALRAWHRYRPDEGWLPVFLLAGLLYLLAQTVASIEWTAEIGVVHLASGGGFLLALILARRPVSGRFAWALLSAYGLAVILLYLGRLWPPWGAHMRQDWALLLDRLAGWMAAVTAGERTRETIVFSFGVGALAWLLAAFAAWSVFRRREPLPAVSALGLALALNSYFGEAPLWPAAIFVGLAVLLVAVIHMADAERLWDQRGVDYSLEIRRDLLVYGLGISLLLFSVALVLPTIDFQAISQAILGRDEVRQAEGAFDRAFAGVRRPQQPVRPLPVAPRPGLPQSFLVGNPPELAETLVMTATVAGPVRPATHWRGRSYDLYTGLGWAVSAERQQAIPAAQPIPLPPVIAGTTLTQSVRWLVGDNPIRYTLGLPQAFDQAVTVFWRGLDDLSRAQGNDAEYAAASRVSAATVDDLRRAGLDQVPEAIVARYTALPESVPQRVLDLAEEIVASLPGQPSAYDQARALEQFLRQYPYSLEVELPPQGTDPVDFFLFDLQGGYCDYYASAMVVLARALGLPARLGAGFLVQPTGEAGFQAIYQINAHSWAEVYFAGYGWIEFEPTAAFPSAESATGPFPTEQSPFDLPGGGFAPLPMPAPTPVGPSPWWWLALLIPLFLGGLGWLRRRQGVRLSGVQWTYDRLQRRARRLGQEVPASQTPAEFAAGFVTQLGRLEGAPLAHRLRLAELHGDIEALSQTFAEYQYGPGRTAAGPAERMWRRLRGRLWLLSWLRRLPGAGPR